MELTTLPDTWLGLLGLVVVTGGPVLVAWLTMRAKRGSDTKDKDEQTVIAAAEETHNLQPVVDTLVRQMARQIAKMEKVEAELEVSRPIVQVRYPLALSHISAFHQLFPGSGLQIPDQLLDDLD